MWKKEQQCLANTSVLLNFLKVLLTTRFRHVSAYYQVIFNTDIQFFKQSFIMIFRRKLNNLLK